jgi:hypothetical protein
VKFEADAWAQPANDAGMKYMVITSGRLLKHRRLLAQPRETSTERGHRRMWR